jgi:hypothetical protein
LAATTGLLGASRAATARHYDQPRTSHRAHRQKLAPRKAPVYRLFDMHVCSS